MFQLDLPYTRNLKGIAQAKVSQIEGEDFVVNIQGYMYRCSLAKGCFVVPEIGDDVLVFLGEVENFILSVLKSSSSSIKFKMYDTQICIEEKKVGIKAPEANIEIERSKERFGKREVTIGEIDICAGEVRGEFGKVFLRIKELFRYVENLFTWVRGLVQTRAKRMKLLIDQDLWIRGQRTSLLGRDKVKIDGRKINLG